jgi:dihydrodipicolinate synthase/N-acetylneuraminate lyase
MNKFRGIFPAIITPMTADGHLNEDAFRQVMEFNIQAGVHGFWVAGGTGESVFLTDEENMRIADISADQNRGRTNIIMHVGAPSTARAARLAENAARAGVEAICCVPPFFYGTTDEAIVEHYRVVAEAADLPLFLYNLPSATGVEITAELAKKIQDRVPRLTGLKHSSLDFARTRAFADMGLRCLTGSCRLMLPGLMIGAVGCVDGPVCAAPEIWVELWNAYNAGDFERARAVQERGHEVSDALTRIAFFDSIKVTLSERLGIDCGSSRPPNARLTPQQRADLKDEVATLGLSRVAVAQAGD